jgi:glutamyl-Q tRNA(Asp) synthetase
LSQGRSPYRGRFAPTPSGPLHFGSVVAATGSYADALAHGGTWHLRIDDLDPPRVAVGATTAILRCLEALGFEWAGPVVHQSERGSAYREALEALRRLAPVYPCACSRAEIAAAGLPGIEGPRYPGTCRSGPRHPERPPAWRLAVPVTPVSFRDLRFGQVFGSLADTVGDFVLQRADGVFSYHLACVIDDAEAGFDHVVRGADLLASTPRQRLLQDLLGRPVPHYLHLPVVVDASGQKLSKQSRAPEVDAGPAGQALWMALEFLGQRPPPELAGATPREIWRWVAGHWQRDIIPDADLPAGLFRRSASPRRGA